MATWEDKILGGPAENYCSSDDEEHEEDRVEAIKTGESRKSENQTSDEGPPPIEKFTGTSKNTGPKGVLRDWELYQQHQKFVREQKEQELITMVKASSLSCTTTAEDEKAEKILEEIAATCDDLDDLLSDKDFEQFVKQRMQLMTQTNTQSLKYGKGVADLKNADEFLKIIDDSDHRVSVIVHIYDDKYSECSTMNECLKALSDLYPHVQFCKIRADAVGVSLAFEARGIPALLVYKGGNLVGNFVQLKEEFGHDFYVGDVENFLIENGMIEDRNNIPKLLAKAKSSTK